MDIIFDKEVKTRKVHDCFACNRRFPKGTIMQRQVNTFDGINSVYICVTCRTLFKDFKDWFFDDFDCVFPSECVAEQLNEGETPEELLIRLEQENG